MVSHHIQLRKDVTKNLQQHDNIDRNTFFTSFVSRAGVGLNTIALTNQRWMILFDNKHKNSIFECTVTTSDTMCAAPVFNCGQDQVWQVLHQLFVPPSATLAFDRWKNVQKIRNYFSKNMSRNNFTLNLSVAIFISCWWVIAGVRRGVCSSGSCQILRESLKKKTFYFW